MTTHFIKPPKAPNDQTGLRIASFPFQARQNLAASGNICGTSTTVICTQKVSLRPCQLGGDGAAPQGATAPPICHLEACGTLCLFRLMAAHLRKLWSSTH